MAIKESMLPEFEHEMATTGVALDRVPAEHAAWKPHPKSMSLGEVASQPAEIPFRVQPTVQADSLDTAPLEGDAYRTPAFASRGAGRPAV
jgi:hypothetical protein